MTKLTVVPPSHGPWDRQAGESAQAFEAFRTYLEMGADRSLEAVSQKVAKSVPLMKRWSARWQWSARAAAYDAHLASIEMQATERTTATEAEKWAKRQAEQRERDWDMAERLRDKAVAMLEYPLTEEVTIDGKTAVFPSKWTLRDAAMMAETAAKLARLAAEMATSRVNFEDMSDDELERIAKAG